VRVPSSQVYGGHDRRVSGVEYLSPQGLGVFVIHTVLKRGLP
jgi:hypothetical protein